MENNNYAFDLFSGYETSGNAAKSAPKKKEESKNRLVLVEETRVTQRERLRQEERRSFINSVQTLVVAAVMMLLIGSLIYQRVTINVLDHQISEKAEMLEEAESQNVILNIKRDSMVSTDSIRKTAEKLGMIQRDRYQITYFDLSGEDYGVVNPH